MTIGTSGLAWMVASGACLATAPVLVAQDAEAPAPGEAPAAVERTTTTAPAEGLIPIPDYTGGLAERTHLLGDLNGGRTGLAERGLQFRVDLTQYVQSVTSGGLDTATRYGGSVDVFATLDLQQAGLLPGGLITFRGESRFADSINQFTGGLLSANTDMAFPLTTDPNDSLPFAVTELTYTQFLAPQFGLFAGKINTLGGDPNEFASGRGMTQFLNANFVFNPVTGVAVPYSTLGAGFVFIPSAHLTLTGTIMNTADSSTTSGFEDFGDGFTAVAEAQFKYELGDLPGGQNLSFLYAGGNDFVNFARLSFAEDAGLIVPMEDETWSLYWSAWQYLWTDGTGDGPIDLTDGRPDRRGIGLFARAGVGDDETLPIDWNVSGGLGGRGLIPGREFDVFGLGYYYSSVDADRFGGMVEDEVQGFEAFYNLAFTPAAMLTFDVQVLEDSRMATDAAVVLGVRLHLRF